MDLRRAVFIAAFAFAAACGPAAAQFAPPAAVQQGAASPWDRAPAQPGAGAPWPGQPQQPQPQQQQHMEACVQDFGKLRDDAQKKAGLIQAASKNKVSPKEACGLFNSFAAAELKMVKFAQANLAGCGIPKEILDQIKKNHTHTDGIRHKVCQAAAQGPPKPAAPSLADTLNAPIADSSNIKTGRGTFDTLTGTALGPK